MTAKSNKTSKDDPKSFFALDKIIQDDIVEESVSCKLSLKSAILYFSGDAKVRAVSKSDAQYHASLLHCEFVIWCANDKLVGNLDKVVIKYTYKVIYIYIYKYILRAGRRKFVRVTLQNAA